MPLRHVEENNCKSERFSCNATALNEIRFVPISLSVSEGAAILLHNQGLEMRLPPTGLGGSLPLGWVRSLGFPFLPLTNKASAGNL